MSESLLGSYQAGWSATSGVRPTNTVQPELLFAEPSLRRWRFRARSSSPDTIGPPKGVRHGFLGLLWRSNISPQLFVHEYFMRQSVPSRFYNRLLQRTVTKPSSRFAVHHATVTVGQCQPQSRLYRGRFVLLAYMARSGAGLAVSFMVQLLSLVRSLAWDEITLLTEWTDDRWCVRSHIAAQLPLGTATVTLGFIAALCSTPQHHAPGGDV
jgi:hypothetical protein